MWIPSLLWLVFTPISTVPHITLSSSYRLGFMNHPYMSYWRDRSNTKHPKVEMTFSFAPHSIISCLYIAPLHALSYEWEYNSTTYFYANFHMDL